MTNAPSSSGELKRSAPRTICRAAHCSEDEASERFAAERIAAFAAILAGVFAVILVLGGVTAFVVMGRHAFDPVRMLPLAIAVVLAAVAFRARRGGLTRRGLWLLDVGSTWIVSAGAAAVTCAVRTGVRLEAFALLVVCIVLVLRAALVPSSPSRSLWLGAASMAPLLGGAAWTAAVWGSPWPALPIASWIGILAACAALVVYVSVAISRVVFGLRAEARDALRVGTYTLEEKIGEGSFGAIYRARHKLLRRPTAVKLLRPERMGFESLARFEREVQTTAMLTHPNTIAVYDYGRTEDGLFYYAMEYLDGLSLEQLVQHVGGPLPPERVAYLLYQASGALAEAHAIGFIHRDVKPANIFVTERGGAADVVKVLDFGLVKEIRAELGPGLTHANTITGTPLYIAPESITAPETADVRIDVYALGAVGYFLLTGKPPFEGRTVVEVASHHLHSNPVRPSDRVDHELPPKLEALILRCLAKDPDDRPRDARELHDLLADCVRESPWLPADAYRWWSRYREGAKETRDLAGSTRPSRVFELDGRPAAEEHVDRAVREA